MAVFGGGGSVPHPPQAFWKAMVFVDGTNLFHRLKDDAVKVSDLYRLLESAVGKRQLVAAHLYTLERHLQEAKAIHGEDLCKGIRVKLGHGLPKEGAKSREKGVDAQLVADVVYHAASRNCDYVLVVTADTDFVYALRRVQDFGCRTGLLAICCEAHEMLVAACDEYIMWDLKELEKMSVATKIT